MEIASGGAEGALEFCFCQEKDILCRFHSAVAIGYRVLLRTCRGNSDHKETEVYGAHARAGWYDGEYRKTKHTNYDGCEGNPASRYARDAPACSLHGDTTGSQGSFPRPRSPTTELQSSRLWKSQFGKCVLLANWRPHHIHRADWCLLQQRRAVLLARARACSLHARSQVRAPEPLGHSQLLYWLPERVLGGSWIADQFFSTPPPFPAQGSGSPPHLSILWRDGEGSGQDGSHNGCQSLLRPSERVWCVDWLEGCWSQGGEEGGISCSSSVQWPSLWQHCWLGSWGMCCVEGQWVWSGGKYVYCCKEVEKSVFVYVLMFSLIYTYCFSCTHQSWLNWEPEVRFQAIIVCIHVGVNFNHCLVNIQLQFGTTISSLITSFHDLKKIIILTSNDRPSLCPTLSLLSIDIVI